MPLEIRAWVVTNSEEAFDRKAKAFEILLLTLLPAEISEPGDLALIGRFARFSTILKDRESADRNKSIIPPIL
ncbi:MAG: hypothetical protein ACXWM7_00185 [Parachlamydiaceae bacterium]